MAIVLNGTTGITAPDISVTAQSTDITTTGDITAVDATLSGGVYLGGTGAANYLNDYEEGTWTPTIKSGSNTITYDTPNSSGFTYRKIGKQVTVCFYLEQATTSGTTGGQASIEGFPFTSSSRFSTASNRIMFYSTGLRFSDAYTFGMLRANSTTMAVTKKNNATDPYANATVSAVGSNTYIFFELTYFTDA